MRSTQLLDTARRITAARADQAATKPTITACLTDIEHIIAWAEAQRAALITQLAAIDSFPEATIAETSRCTLNAASKNRDRADTLSAIPGLADSLENGRITTGHIDAITRASKNIDPDRRDELLDLVDDLVDIAETATIAEFDRRMKLEVTRLDNDNGETRLTRQKAAVRLRTWTDHDGMWNLNARFDPVTALTLSTKIDHAVQALFAEATPDHCPTDPVEKNRFLAAHALSRLITNRTAAISDQPGCGGSKPDRVDCLVVIDADAPDQTGPVAHYALPVEIPIRVLAELVDGANTDTVIIRNGIVLHAPGNTDLGRTTRLANRAQRRALRALYTCCAIPGYDRCKIHHITWWRNGGTTDLDNLLPVCTKHHTKIHHDDWIVTLGPRRQLTLTLPDGTRHKTGPPTIRAA